MSDIFISYSSKNRARAKVLAGALERQGWSVWWDRKIPPGKQFSQVIKEAVDEAKCIIVLWSKESVKSEWVQNEASEGARRKILVPALIDDVEIPFEFRRIQAARLVDWEGRSPHLEFDTLLEAVRAILGQPLLPQRDSEVPSRDVFDHSKPTDLETEKAGSKRQTAKVLAAICIVALIVIVSIVVFLKYRQPKTYSLDIPHAVGGSVTKDPNQTSYNDGDNVTLQAVADAEYTFTGWSGDLPDSNNPAELVMNADKSVTASFALKTYRLDIPHAVGGSVTKDPNQASYKHGETVTLEAVPNTGYSFKNWSGDLSDSNNSAELVMNADKSVTASFADLKTGDVITNSIGMKLVYIRADSFTMGSDSATQLASEYHSDKSLFTDEFPQHQVHISKGFRMGQTEVTQGQYESVMNAQPWSGQRYVQEAANNPAVYVTWEDANDFCEKLSKKEGKTYRLPTEAEWEYACRAGTTARFSFGDSDASLDDYAWYRSNALEVGQEYAHSVGQKKPNRWGLYDMHGNVCEWCSDWYDEDYYSNSPSVDPNGPSSGASRSLRGGSWYGAGDYLRCSVRCLADPVVRGSLVGFRVVLSQ